MEDPFWEPDENASDEEWELFDDTCRQMDEEEETDNKVSSEDEDE